MKSHHRIVFLPVSDVKNHYNVFSSKFPVLILYKSYLLCNIITQSAKLNLLDLLNEHNDPKAPIHLIN